MAFLEVSFAEYMVTARVRKTVTILPPISGIDIQLQMRRFDGNRRDTFYSCCGCLAYRPHAQMYLFKSVTSAMSE